jgi:hypothetical protein
MTKNNSSVISQSSLVDKNILKNLDPLKLKRDSLSYVYYFLSKENYSPSSFENLSLKDKRNLFDKNGFLAHLSFTLYPELDLTLIQGIQTEEVLSKQGLASKLVDSASSLIKTTPRVILTTHLAGYQSGEIYFFNQIGFTNIPSPELNNFKEASKYLSKTPGARYKIINSN